MISEWVCLSVSGTNLGCGFARRWQSPCGLHDWCEHSIGSWVSGM